MNILIAIIVLVVLYLFANRIYRKYWNKGLSIQLNFDKSILTENETGHLTEIISNHNFLPIPALWIKFSTDRSLNFKDQKNVTISDKCYKNDIFSILFYQKITKKLTFTAGHRGFFQIKSIDMVASDLTLSDSLVTSVPCDTTLVVYPRLIETRDIEIPFNRIMGEVISRRHIYEDPFEFSGIRPYIQGDNPKDINWKATSKTGTFQTNVHQYTAGQEIAFLFDHDSEGLLNDSDIIEEAIRIIATLSTLFTLQGINVSFYTNAVDILTARPSLIHSGCGRQHCEDIYHTLARLNLEADSEKFVSFASKLLAGSTINENALIILVSSARDTATLNFFDALLHTENTSAFWIFPTRTLNLTNPVRCPDRILHWEVKL